MTLGDRDARSMPALLLALGLVTLLVAGPSRAEWDFSGEVGAELDSVGEDFGSGAAIDDQFDPTDPLDDLSDTIRFQDRTTESSGVLSLRLRDDRTRRFDGTLRLKSRPEKSRAEVDLRGELGTGAGRWRWADRVYSEIAGSEADGGWVNLGEVGWSVPRTFGGVGFGVRLAHELSRAGEDSLAALFDYQLLRPSVEIVPRIGSFSLSVEAGTQHKRIVDDGDGSYDGSWLELRSYGPRLSYTARLESRGYADSDSLRPSYQEIALRADGSLPLTNRDEGRMELLVRSLQYGIDSSIFRDHWEGEVGLFLRRELGDEDSSVRVDASPVTTSRGLDRTAPVRTPSEGEGASTSGRAATDDDSTRSDLDLLDAAISDLTDFAAEYDPSGLAAGSDSGAPADSSATASDDSGAPADSSATAGDDSGAPADSSATASDEYTRSYLAPVSSSGHRTEEGRRTSTGTLRSLARWYVEFGALGSGNLGEVDDSGDYTEVAGRFSFGRQADERIWLDLSIGLGRRDYLRDRAATDLVFEGFDFSVAGSDYDYFEVSTFGEARLPASFTLGLFAQYEDQRHDDDADDFRLWILTASLVRRF